MRRLSLILVLVTLLLVVIALPLYAADDPDGWTPDDFNTSRNVYVKIGAYNGSSTAAATKTYYDGSDFFGQYNDYFTGRVVNYYRYLGLWNSGLSVGGEMTAEFSGMPPLKNLIDQEFIFAIWDNSQYYPDNTEMSFKRSARITAIDIIEDDHIIVASGVAPFDVYPANGGWCYLFRFDMAGHSSSYQDVSVRIHYDPFYYAGPRGEPATPYAFTVQTRFYGLLPYELVSYDYAADENVKGFFDLFGDADVSFLGGLVSGMTVFGTAVSVWTSVFTPLFNAYVIMYPLYLTVALGIIGVFFGLAYKIARKKE